MENRAEKKRGIGGRECLSIEQRTSKTALKYHCYNLGLFSIIFSKPSIFIRFARSQQIFEKILLGKIFSRLSWVSNEVAETACWDLANVSEDIWFGK
jgi:hypothetical protein